MDGESSRTDANANANARANGHAEKQDYSVSSAEHVPLSRQVTPVLSNDSSAAANAADRYQEVNGRSRDDGDDHAVQGVPLDNLDITIDLDTNATISASASNKNQNHGTVENGGRDRGGGAMALPPRPPEPSAGEARRLTPPPPSADLDRKRAAAAPAGKHANAGGGIRASSLTTGTMADAAVSSGAGKRSGTSTPGRSGVPPPPHISHQSSPLVTHKRHAREKEREGIGAGSGGSGSSGPASLASGSALAPPPPLPSFDSLAGKQQQQKQRADASSLVGNTISLPAASSSTAAADANEATGPGTGSKSSATAASARQQSTQQGIHHRRSASLPEHFGTSVDGGIVGAGMTLLSGTVGDDGSVDVDSLAPVDIQIDDDSPAAEALRANAAVSVSKIDKFARKINAQTVRRAAKKGMVMVKAKSTFGERRGKPPRVPARIPLQQRSNSFGDAADLIYHGNLMSLAEEDEEALDLSASDLDLSKEAKVAFAEATGGAVAGAGIVGEGDELETQSLPEKVSEGIAGQHVSFAIESDHDIQAAAAAAAAAAARPITGSTTDVVDELGATLRTGTGGKSYRGHEEEKTEVEPIIDHAPSDDADSIRKSKVGDGAAAVGAAAAAAAVGAGVIAAAAAPLTEQMPPSTISPTATAGSAGSELLVEFPSMDEDENESIGKAALSRLQHTSSPEGEKSAKSAGTHRTKETRFAESLEDFRHISERLRKKKRKKDKLSKRKSYVRGKVIDGKHELYTLSIAVMLGLRTSISQTNKQLTSNAASLTGTDKHRHLLQWLDGDDFMAVEKYEFRPRGTDRTPPHKLSHTFKFKDYSPLAFAYIRRMFGVNEYEFLSSVCGNANFIEFISNAKSGQFFFYSHDGRYMIKTMTNAESKFLRRILPHYFRHCCQNPNTLLTKFLGMYRVKLYHLRRNVKFIIMNSVFDTDKYLQSFYDLKGSVIGREAKPGEEVKKDNDVRAGLPESAFALPKELRERMREQVVSDCNFLKEMKIMDYSMLIGVHHIPASAAGVGGTRKSGGTSVSSAAGAGRKNSLGFNASLRSGGGSGGGAGAGDAASLASSTGMSLRSVLEKTIRERPAAKVVVAAGEAVEKAVFPESSNEGAPASAAAAEIRRENPSTTGKSSYLSDAHPAPVKHSPVGAVSGSAASPTPLSDDGASQSNSIAVPTSIVAPSVQPVLSSESKNTGTSAGVDAVVSDRSVTSYSTMDPYYDDDDDYSYLEGTFTRKRAAAETPGGSVDDWERFNPTSAPGKADELERKREEATEQMFWPFHRLYNLHGRRRMVPIASSSALEDGGATGDGNVDNDGDGDAATAVVDNVTKDNGGKEHCSCLSRRAVTTKWPIPQFATPISNRKDGGLMMDVTGLELPKRRVDPSLGKIQYYEGKIFYMGIIDVLQQFNIRKRVEAKWRRLQGGGWQDASCVHPNLYADRFVRFFDEYSQRIANVDEDDEDLDNVEEVIFYKNEQDKSDRSSGPLVEGGNAGDGKSAGGNAVMEAKT